MRNNKYELRTAINNEVMEEDSEKAMDLESMEAARMAQYDEYECKYPWKSGQEFEDFRAATVARIRAGEKVSGEDYRKADIYSVWYNKDKTVDRIFFNEDASYADWYEKQEEIEFFRKQEEDRKYDQMLQELEDRS
jgi:hypothetical protein